MKFKGLFICLVCVSWPIFAQELNSLGEGTDYRWIQIYSEYDGYNEPDRMRQRVLPLLEFKTRRECEKDLYDAWDRGSLRTWELIKIDSTHGGPEGKVFSVRKYFKSGSLVRIEQYSCLSMLYQSSAE